ncbi:uncharacterized protein LOC131023287 [Salvia miltiorrhiza]|uniref:uncharacterized protein LOC131023287 n=1 Tax=Salvia miltiorrhiza TaxID=226208 RepID=UPI0025ABDAE9|nr:uncharacterized protein LOC131023287 [Salvia miltiorrhiza]
MMLKKELNDLWGIASSWQLIPLGKGYYTLVFQSEADKTCAKVKNTWELLNGHLRLREWSRNFDPFKEHSSLANVWVRIHYLPIEYWHAEVLAGVARYIGHPIRIDAASVKKDFGQFARVLVELDMSKPLPTTLLFDEGDFAFYIEFTYEKLPLYCNRCKITGHSPDRCFKAIQKETDETTTHVKIATQQPRGKQWKEIEHIQTTNNEHEAAFHEHRNQPVGDQQIQQHSVKDKQCSGTTIGNTFAVLENLRGEETGLQILEAEQITDKSARVQQQGSGEDNEPKSTTQKVAQPSHRGSSPHLLEQEENAKNRISGENVRFQLRNNEDIRGPDMLDAITNNVETSVYDRPLEVYVSESSEEEETIEADVISEEIHSRQQPTDAVAFENAMKAQRLEQILALAKEPITSGMAAKRRGRPSKKQLADRAAEQISKQAEESIKHRLRKAGDAGNNPEAFVIDNSKKDCIQAMENVARESWSAEVERCGGSSAHFNQSS